MWVESWLPVGFELPGGERCSVVQHAGPGWQILKTQGGGSALVAIASLAARWQAAGLVGGGDLSGFSFGANAYQALCCGTGQALEPVAHARTPSSVNETLAFATALGTTRRIDAHSPLHDALYAEALGCLLPTYGTEEPAGDDVVLGRWLTGGAHVSALNLRQLGHTLSWMRADDLRDVVEAAGLDTTEAATTHEPAGTIASRTAHLNEPLDAETASIPAERQTNSLSQPFELAGRPELEDFFNEHVVDIVRHKERYAALGIGFPSAVILHGPPGCGKTFAVEQLIDYLGWPSFEIDASSVASAYIHETSKKVAEVFKKAMRSAPSVLVIDEMEAFLADREAGSASSHHRVEEVAEFLRRIPEAVKNEVLIIAMTNRIEMIDAAILRRGRFDHVIKVDYASAEEVLAMLAKLLQTLPQDATVDAALLAKKLAGRPLSDVSFVVREGARLAAKAGEDKLTQDFLLAALDSAPSRDGATRRIGFL